MRFLIRSAIICSALFQFGFLAEAHPPVVAHHPHEAESRQPHEAISRHPHEAASHPKARKPPEHVTANHPDAPKAAKH
jgi:hypothetical protein